MTVKEKHKSWEVKINSDESLDDGMGWHQCEIQAYGKNKDELRENLLRAIHNLIDNLSNEYDEGCKNQLK